MVTLYKPTVEAIQEQARLAREQEEKRKQESGDILWGNIDEGSNVIRLLPPTNSRGVIAKKVVKHYFSETPFSEHGSCRCLTGTHPEVEGVRCPIHDVADKLLAQYPELNVSRWMKPGYSCMVQAIDRKEKDPSKLAARIYRLTPGVYNWVIMQMEELLQDGIDITDLQQGMDIKITKTVEKKKTKKGSRDYTKYTPTLWSVKGPSPLHEDQDVVQKILNSMKDLDEIWKYPDDEGIADLVKIAAEIQHYYMRKEAKAGAQIQVPAVQVVQPLAPQVVQQAPQPIQQQLPVQQPAPQPQVVQQAETPVVQAPPPQQQAVAAAPSSPTDKPPCFGGAAPRNQHPEYKEGVTVDDGSNDWMGYFDQSELCLMCPHEFECDDASKAKAAS